MSNQPNSQHDDITKEDRRDVQDRYGDLSNALTCLHIPEGTWNDVVRAARQTGIRGIRTATFSAAS